MKKILLFMGLLLVSFHGLCSSLVSDTPIVPPITFLNKLGVEPKQNEKFKGLLLIRAGMNNTFADDLKYQNTNFSFDAIRFQIFGKLSSWLDYNIRQRFNGSSSQLAWDNSSFAIDLAYLNFTLSHWGITIGKQAVSYGGWEMDVSPVDINQFSDFVGYIDFYTVGSTIEYNFHHQKLAFQVLESHSGDFESWYGFKPNDIIEPQVPLAYTLGWYGSLFHDIIQTRWTISLVTEAQHEKVYFLALGTQLTLPKLRVQFDYYLSYEEIDSKLYITDVINEIEDPLYPKLARNTEYSAVITRFDYEFLKNCIGMFKYTYENEFYKENNSPLSEPKFCNVHSYVSGVEYKLPVSGLKAFVYLTQQYKNYKKEVNQIYHVKDYSRSRFSLGFLYKLPLF